jgi:hypothetical protein
MFRHLQQGKGQCVRITGTIDATEESLLHSVTVHPLRRTAHV